MLVRNVTLHNVGPFKHLKVSVGDKRGIVCFVAPNGRGKSSTLELGILGALYRKTETQGTLKDRATDRDAWVELDADVGAPFRIRQVVDAGSRNAEALVLDLNDMKPVLADTKVTSFGAWAERNLPDPDVYLAGPFCAQQSEGFVQMSSAERISVILKVRGIARLELMAKAAGKRASKASDAFQALVTRIADAAAGASAVEEAEASLAAAREAAASDDAAVLAAKERLAEGQRAVADHAVRVAAHAAATKLVGTLNEQHQAAMERVRQAEQSLVSARAVLADADAIRAAVAALPEAERSVQELRAAWSAAEAEIRAQLDPWRDGAARLKAAHQRRASAAQRLSDAPAIRAAAAEKSALKEAATAARAAADAAERELEALQGRQLAGTADRLTRALAGHDEILSLSGVPLADAQAVSRASKDADAADVAAATEAPAQQKAARAARDAARDRAAVADRALAEAEKLAAREPDLAVAEADQAAAEAEIEAVLGGHSAAVIGAALRALGRLDVAVAGAAAAKVVAEAKPVAARLPALETAEGLIAQTEPQLAAAQADASRLAEQIAGVEVVEPGDVPDVLALERDVTAREEAAKSAMAAVVKGEEALTRAHAVAARVAELEAEKAAAAAELADWTLLEQHLGRKGIQSAEVDAAGPELTELVNNLLHTCHGPQFTVEVKTQRLDGAGKKLLDECTVRVIDSVKGTDKELREHSGGERVLLGLAMRLGLAMMGSRKAGLTDFTLVCDEGGAALDKENERAFVAMLRHALAVTGARHVLLVSHSEEVQKMCDHRIEIPEAA